MGCVMLLRSIAACGRRAWAPTCSASFRRSRQPSSWPLASPCCRLSVVGSIPATVTSCRSFPNASVLARFLHVPSEARLVDNPASKGQEADCKSNNAVESTTNKTDKPSLWSRFKQMYREYWYVLVPVHIVTSIVWFGGFYYAATSGIDIVPLLESLGASERITKPLKTSGAGYVAVAYAMYKLATPARYMVTLGGTTFTITYLRRLGLIKPAPSPEQVRTIIQAKRADFQERRRLRKASRLKKREQFRKRFKRPEG